MTDYRAVLRAIAPGGKPDIINGFADALPQVIAYAALTTRQRLADFLGQCAEESANFTTTTEFASGAAYNGRRDLGNVHPGDGVRFKGRGLIQLTGRTNYREAGQALGHDYENHPEWVATFPHAALVSAWFWKRHDINVAADRGNLAQVTRAVNGGENGFSTRVALTHRALNALVSRAIG